MKICLHRCFLVLWCTLALIAFSAATAASTPSAKDSSSAQATKPPESKATAEDPLGRGTPYGTVIGFLRAADKAEYERAALYLDGKQPAQKKEQLVRDLKIVLNRGLKIGLDDLSKAPEGRLDDDLDVYLEKVGTVKYGDESLDIVLRRTTKSDTPPIWLFSLDTLRNVRDAADRFELSWSEALWPDDFRELNVLSYPLFMLLNQLVGIPLLLLASWLLATCIVRLVRPRILRVGQQYGARALAEFRWLLTLLIFAVVMRIAAPQIVTVAGRILFASVGSVLIIAAVTGLLVRMTSFATRLRITRLQESGMPGSIAGAELLSWFLMCLWVIAGVFLSLRSLGFEATAAVAGLGVGGIAIAFAAQKTIENLFGTVTIVTDKAIRVGDQCQAGSTEGAVESIGLRSTRIRTLDRALVTIPNGQLASMTIGNVTHRDKFLFRHNVRLHYQTTADQLRDVLANITQMMSAHPKLDTASIRTRLVRFADYSLDIEVFAYVLTRDAPSFLDVQEELLLKIMDIVEASGTSIALPFQTDSSPRDSEPEERPLDTLPPAKQVKSA